MQMGDRQLSASEESIRDDSQKKPPARLCLRLKSLPQSPTSFFRHHFDSVYFQGICWGYGCLSLPLMFFNTSDTHAILATHAIQTRLKLTQLTDDP